MDSKTKVARNPARSKTNNSKHGGSDTGKKPDRSITRSKGAKGHLPGIEQRLLGTYEHAPIGIIENSLEGNYVNCNEEFCRITGYEKEELLTLNIKDLTYEEDYIFDIKLHQRLVAGEIPFYKLEKRYVRKNGQLIWAEVSRSLMHDADGKPLYTIGAVLDVSERRQAEKALRESEEKYRTLFNSIDEGFCIIEKLEGRAGEPLDFRYTAANPAFAAQSGVGNVVGKTIRQAFPGEPDEWFETYDTILRTGNAIRFERDLVTQGRVLELYAFRVEDEMHPRVAVIFKDITERKQAEEALSETKERYRNLFHLVPVAVYSCDAEGLIQEYNQRAVELWGREPHKNDPDERYCGAFKIYYPDGGFMPHEACPMARILGGETLEPHELEILVERPDGVRRNVLAHPLALKNERGEITGAINCLYDITERKQAEAALQLLNLQLESLVQSRTQRLNEVVEALRAEISERKRAEGQLVYQAQLIANVNDAIIATDADLAISYWNRAAEQIYGWKAEEVLGRRVSEVLQSEFLDGNTYPDALQKVNETGELRTAVTHLRKDGTRIFIDAHTSTLRNGEDSIVGYISVNHDITERTQMDEALRSSRERLQMLSRRLVEVQEEERRAIARELHDRVGQTLAALNINLMIMNGQLLEDSKQRIGSRMSDTMNLVAEAIALVRNVMTDLRPAVLDDYGLEAALQSYIDEYRSRYDIKVILDPPQQPIPRLGPSLEMTLLRITQEALFNIARHAQADQVNISLRLQDDAVHMIVQDNGVGIQSWQEVNRPGSHGLTIMRERADAFGGRLNVGSAPGKGTKLEVSIPLQNGNQNKVQEAKKV